MDTTERVRVIIDLGRVAHNLRPADGGEADAGTAEAFLRKAGFNPDEHGAWLGTRAGLRLLNYSEVVRVEAVA